MTDEAIKNLVNIAADLAIAGAKRFMEKHGLVASSEALAMALTEEVNAAMTEAIRDAREAMACNMVDVAEQTFRASMVLAGIKAAQRATRDPQGIDGDK